MIVANSSSDDSININVTQVSISNPKILQHPANAFLRVVIGMCCVSDDFFDIIFFFHFVFDWPKIVISVVTSKSVQGLHRFGEE
jgi:hypothetical protein